MLLHEEPTLFGAAPGRIDSVMLHVTIHDKVREVWLSGKPINKKERISLIVRMPADQSATAAIGAMMSIVLRSGDIGTQLWRRSLWATHNRLGADGYEVQLYGAGRDPYTKK